MDTIFLRDITDSTIIKYNLSLYLNTANNQYSANSSYLTNKEKKRKEKDSADSEDRMSRMTTEIFQHGGNESVSFCHAMQGVKQQGILYRCKLDEDTFENIENIN
ncbi:hypothetical protein V1477_005147 [Vespula maculifrons]|uniref:Uncharacterized protein n=1 Tax=Vespula maculifrons TaxID=7453 RepID=A0ABD2CNV0_VESMC